MQVRSFAIATAASLSLAAVGACGGTAASTHAQDDATGSSASSTAEATRGRAPRGEPPLWAEPRGAGPATVVFISGNGNDHSVWLPLRAPVEAAGVATFVYDRAGMGQSPLFDLPYTVDDEASALAATLDHHGISGPLVLVAHSYGGHIAALLTERSPDVVGLVFVDAPVPGELGPPVVEELLATYVPQFDELRRRAPELAPAIIPVVESLPATGQRLASVSIDPDLPVRVIAPESTYVEGDEAVAHVAAAREAFVAGSTSRTLLKVDDSSHNVMRDQPDVVTRTVLDLLGELGLSAASDAR